MPGSSSQGPVKDLVDKAEAAGIPATVKPASEIGIPMDGPEIRASTAKLVKHLEDPEETPVHHTEIEVEDRKEVVVDATALDPERTWFFMGFMYALLKGLDRSMFEVFRAAGDTELSVLTHQAELPVVGIRGADFSKNSWSGIVQGIPHESADAFTKFVASYRFKSGSPEIHDPKTDEVWRVDWQDIRIADPFRDSRVGATIRVALPVNLLTKRGIRLVAEAGLLLKTPEFAVVALPDDEEAKQYG